MAWEEMPWASGVLRGSGKLAACVTETTTGHSAISHVKEWDLRFILWSWMVSWGKLQPIADDVVHVFQFEVGADIEGAAASRALPQPLFGREPIWKTSLPPLTTSELLIQGLLSGFPFKVADWIYLFAADTFFASMIKVFPRPTLIVVFSKIGLPMSKIGRPGHCG